MGIYDENNLFLDTGNDATRVHRVMADTTGDHLNPSFINYGSRAAGIGALDQTSKVTLRFAFKDDNGKLNPKQMKQLYDHDIEYDYTEIDGNDNEGRLDYVEAIVSVWDSSAKAFSQHHRQVLSVQDLGRGLLSLSCDFDFGRQYKVQFFVSSWEGEEWYMADASGAEPFTFKLGYTHERQLDVDPTNNIIPGLPTPEGIEKLRGIPSDHDDYEVAQLMIRDGGMSVEEVGNDWIRREQPKPILKISTVLGQTELDDGERQDDMDIDGGVKDPAVQSNTLSNRAKLVLSGYHRDDAPEWERDEFHGIILEMYGEGFDVTGLTPDESTPQQDATSEAYLPSEVSEAFYTGKIVYDDATKEVVPEKGTATEGKLKKKWIRDRNVLGWKGDGVVLETPELGETDGGRWAGQTFTDDDGPTSLIADPERPNDDSMNNARKFARPASVNPNLKAAKHTRKSGVSDTIEFMICAAASPNWRDTPQNGVIPVSLKNHHEHTVCVRPRLGLWRQRMSNCVKITPVAPKEGGIVGTIKTLNEDGNPLRSQKDTMLCDMEININADMPNEMMHSANNYGVSVFAKQYNHKDVLSLGEATGKTLEERMYGSGFAFASLLAGDLTQKVGSPGDLRLSDLIREKNNQLETMSEHLLDEGFQLLKELSQREADEAFYGKTFFDSWDNESANSGLKLSLSHYKKAKRDGTYLLEEGEKIMIYNLGNTENPAKNLVTGPAVGEPAREVSYKAGDILESTKPILGEKDILPEAENEAEENYLFDYDWEPLFKHAAQKERDTGVKEDDWSYYPVVVFLVPKKSGSVEPELIEQIAPPLVFYPHKQAEAPETDIRHRWDNDNRDKGAEIKLRTVDLNAAHGLDADGSYANAEEQPLHHYTKLHVQYKRLNEPEPPKRPPRIATHVGPQPVHDDDDVVYQKAPLSLVNLTDSSADVLVKDLDTSGDLGLTLEELKVEYANASGQRKRVLTRRYELVEQDSTPLGTYFSHDGKYVSVGNLDRAKIDTATLPDDEDYVYRFKVEEEDRDASGNSPDTTWNKLDGALYKVRFAFSSSAIDVETKADLGCHDSDESVYGNWRIVRFTRPMYEAEKAIYDATDFTLEHADPHNGANDGAYMPKYGANTGKTYFANHNRTGDSASVTFKMTDPMTASKHYELFNGFDATTESLVADVAGQLTEQYSEIDSYSDPSGSALDTHIMSRRPQVDVYGTDDDYAGESNAYINDGVTLDTASEPALSTGNLINDLPNGGSIQLMTLLTKFKLMDDTSKQTQTETKGGENKHKVYRYKQLTREHADHLAMRFEGVMEPLPLHYADNSETPADPSDRYANIYASAGVAINRTPEIIQNAKNMGLQAKFVYGNGDLDELTEAQRHSLIALRHAEIDADDDVEIGEGDETLNSGVAPEREARQVTNRLVRYLDYADAGSEGQKFFSPNNSGDRLKGGVSGRKEIVNDDTRHPQAAHYDEIHATDQREADTATVMSLGVYFISPDGAESGYIRLAFNGIDDDSEAHDKYGSKRKPNRKYAPGVDKRAAAASVTMMYENNLPSDMVTVDGYDWDSEYDPKLLGNPTTNGAWGNGVLDHSSDNFFKRGVQYPHKRTVPSREWKRFIDVQQVSSDHLRDDDLDSSSLSGGATLGPNDPIQATYEVLSDGSHVISWWAREERSGGVGSRPVFSEMLKLFYNDATLLPNKFVDEKAALDDNDRNVANNRDASDTVYSDASGNWYLIGRITSDMDGIDEPDEQEKPTYAINSKASERDAKHILEQMLRYVHKSKSLQEVYEVDMSGCAEDRTQPENNDTFMGRIRLHEEFLDDSGSAATGLPVPNGLEFRSMDVKYDDNEESTSETTPKDITDVDGQYNIRTDFFIGDGGHFPQGTLSRHIRSDRSNFYGNPHELEYEITVTTDGSDNDKTRKFYKNRAECKWLNCAGSEQGRDEEDLSDAINYIRDHLDVGENASIKIQEFFTGGKARESRTVDAAESKLTFRWADSDIPKSKTQFEAFLNVTDRHGVSGEVLQIYPEGNGAVRAPIEMDPAGVLQPSRPNTASGPNLLVKPPNDLEKDTSNLTLQFVNRGIVWVVMKKSNETIGKRKGNEFYLTQTQANADDNVKAGRTYFMDETDSHGCEMVEVDLSDDSDIMFERSTASASSDTYKHENSRMVDGSGNVFFKKSDIPLTEEEKDLIESGEYRLFAVIKNGDLTSSAVLSADPFNEVMKYVPYGTAVKVQGWTEAHYKSCSTMRRNYYNNYYSNISEYVVTGWNLKTSKRWEDKTRDQMDKLQWHSYDINSLEGEHHIELQVRNTAGATVVGNSIMLNAANADGETLPEDPNTGFTGQKEGHVTLSFYDFVKSSPNVNGAHQSGGFDSGFRATAEFGEIVFNPMSLLRSKKEGSFAIPRTLVLAIVWVGDIDKSVHLINGRQKVADATLPGTDQAVYYYLQDEDKWDGSDLTLQN